MRVMNLSMKGNSVINVTCEFTCPLLRNLLVSSQNLSLLFYFVRTYPSSAVPIQTNEQVKNKQTKKSCQHGKQSLFLEWKRNKRKTVLLSHKYLIKTLAYLDICHFSKKGQINMLSK